MSRHLISDSIMTDIADAIREKTSSQESIIPSAMSAVINSISPSGGDDISEYIDTNITTNGGTYSYPIPV